MERIVTTEFASQMAEIYVRLKQLEEDTYNLQLSRIKGAESVGEDSYNQISDKLLFKVVKEFESLRAYIKAEITNDFSNMLEDDIKRVEIA